MRFWPNSDLTAPVQWYYVPRDRPFLPLKEGWLWWDSERDPENEGIRRATGELVLGEDYLTDPTWANGRDPTHTRWVEGVFQGEPEWWRGVGIPDPVPVNPLILPPLVQWDCCNKFPVGERCGDVFFPNNGPRFYVVDFPGAVALVPLEIPPRVPLPAGNYAASWLGPVPPCAWGGIVIPTPFNVDGVQALIQIGGSEGDVAINLAFFENRTFTLAAIYSLAARQPKWDGLAPRTLALSAGSTHWQWPPTLALTSIP